MRHAEEPNMGSGSSISSENSSYRRFILWKGSGEVSSEDENVEVGVVEVVLVEGAEEGSDGDVVVSDEEP